MAAAKYSLDLSAKYALGEPVVYDGKIYYVLGMVPGRSYNVITYNYILGAMKSLEATDTTLDRVDDSKTITVGEYKLTSLAAAREEQKSKLYDMLNQLDKRQEEIKKQLEQLEQA